MKEIFESFSDRRFPMPYINIKITREGTTAEQKAELIKGATELLARVLNKNPRPRSSPLKKWTRTAGVSAEIP